MDGQSWEKDCKEAGRLYVKDEELTAKYAQACTEAAGELRVPCVDLHTAMINQVSKVLLKAVGKVKTIRII